MKRPAIWILVFLAVGIAARQYTSGIALLFILFLSFGLCSLLCYRVKKLYPFVFLFFLLLGALRMQSVNNSFSHFPYGEASQITGVVRSVSTTSYGSARTITEIRSGRNLPQGQKLLATFKEPVEPGQIITFSGTIEPLSPQRNPGGFDEKIYYGARGVRGKLTGGSAVGGQISRDFHTRLALFRIRFSNVYDRLLPEAQSGMMKSIILGDKSDLPEYYSQLYRNAGIYHILVVSGLHLTILSAILYAATRGLFGIKSSGLLVFMGLTLYCIFTGSSPSTIRAVILCGIVILGKSLYRQGDLLSSTAVAAILILSYQPMYLWDVGFQYSFSSVFGIGALQPLVKKYLLLFRDLIPLQWKWLKNEGLSDILSVNFAIGIFTAPIAAYHSYYILPYASLVNLFIIPTLSILVVLGFLTGILGLYLSIIPAYIAGLVHAMLFLYEKTCKLFTVLPFSQILIGAPRLSSIFLYYAALAFVLCYIAYGHFQGKFKQAFTVFIILVTINYSFRYRGLEVTMLDVSQGDCFVVTTPKQAYIIDSGDEWAGQTLTQYLAYKGIAKVDGVFISHTDMDHAGGLPHLLEPATGVHVKALFLPESPLEADSLDLMLLELAAVNNIPVFKLGKGMAVNQDKPLSFHCMWPGPGYYAADKNGYSLVLRMEYQPTPVQFLFTGDIGTREEETLQESPLPLQATFLKLAHHGSKYSNNPGFLEHVQASFFLVSSGKNNIYGHPAPEVLARATELNTPVFNTAQTGAVRIRAHRGKIKIIQTLDVEK